MSQFLYILFLAGNTNGRLSSYNGLTLITLITLTRQKGNTTPMITVITV